MKIFIGIDPGKGHKKGPPRVRGFNTKAELTCCACGIHFVGLKDPDSRRNFCSLKCYRSSLKAGQNPNFRGGTLPLKCKGCGSIFEISRSEKYRRPYCKAECRKASLTERARTVLIRRRIRDSVRKSILSYVRRGTKMNRKWATLLGYDTITLCSHLERQFDGQMNWENYGSYWHIDHIKPVALFAFTTPDCPAFRECWALTNLRPLEAKENQRKGCKYE